MSESDKVVRRAKKDQPETKVESSAEKAERAQRLFKQSQTLHHDLFVLEPAKFIKDTSIGKTGVDQDFFVPISHQHFFHTIDSQGRTQTTCSPIAGHFHKMEIVPSQVEGEPPQLKCVSGPLRRAKVKVGGKWVVKDVPVNDYDHHTHETTYLRSEYITPRKPNIHASNVIKQVADKERAAHIKAPAGFGAIEGS